MQAAQSENSKTILGIVLLMPYFVGLILLSNFGSGATFESAVVFFIMGTASFLFAFIAKSLNYEPFKWLTGKFDKHDLKYIGIGVLGLVMSVVITTSVIPGSVGILVALGFGGAVLTFVLIKSETLVVPWLVHAIYNLLAIALAGGFFSFLGFSTLPLSTSPIFVPNFSLDSSTVNGFFSQAFLQFWGVAFAEEMMRISIALGISMLLTKNKYVMFGIAVTLWSVLHSILSYRIG